MCLKEKRTATEMDKCPDVLEKKQKPWGGGGDFLGSVARPLCSVRTVGWKLNVKGALTVRGI